MLKEKFKEVGRANNEIYSEDLSNIRGSILGVSGSYFTKKMFEGVYTYSDHSIGMSVRMLECKVAKFRKVMAKYNLSVVIVFENYLSVRWNQRNSMLKRTLVQENVQFVNTPYSEHAQLLFYLKNNLLSGIVSELDVIKYFSETNNQVIVDFDLEGGDTFEWIHVSKFLASMNLTLHYARQLLLQELSQRKAQKDVIEQFDSIQKQKHFDRDSSVNHPSYKDQLFRIEYVPVINLHCQLQFYKQTIETPGMEERMKKHFGLLLPPTLYQFFAFDFISSDIINQFGFQRFKYIPNTFDSIELKALLLQTCQHYERVVNLIKSHLQDGTRTDPSTFISEGDELHPSMETSPPKLNYEFIYTDVILLAAFNDEKESTTVGKESPASAFALVKILYRYIETIRKTSRNTSRKNSDQIPNQYSAQQQFQSSESLTANDQQQQLNNNSSSSNSSFILRQSQQLAAEFEEPRCYTTPRPTRKVLTNLQIFSLAALNFFHLQELLNLSRQQFTHLAKYLCKCNFQFSEQLLIFSNIIQNETLCGIFFTHLRFEPEEMQLSSNNAISNPTNTSTVTAQNITTSTGIQITPVPMTSATTPLNANIPPENNSQQQVKQQPSEGSTQEIAQIPAGSASVSSQKPSAENLPQKTQNPLLPPVQNVQSSPQLTGLGSRQSGNHFQELFSRYLIDDRLPEEEKTHILVLSRLFSLSELSFREWKIEEHYDFELTQYIKIIQSVQSILRNQFDCVLLCSYSYIGSNLNMQPLLNTKPFLPFRKNYNCAMGLLLILLLQGNVALGDVLKDEDNFPYIKQELQYAFLLWENILNFIQLQQTDKYVDPSIIKIGCILNEANEYLLSKIDRASIFSTAV